MRQPNKRKKIKKLYILGAGASYASSLGKNDKWLKNKSSPLDKDFSRILSEMEIQKPGWVSKTKNRLLKNWKDHRKFESFGLEQAIIIQIGHLEFIRAIHKRRQTSYGVEDFLNEISHLITYRLEKARESNFNFYKKLASEITKDLEDTHNFRNRIITFNYDTLLDKHLLKKFKPRDLYFDRLQNEKENTKRTAKQIFDHPIMLKLHGSINWSCERSEFLNFFQPVEDDSYKIEKIWHRSSSRIPTPSDKVSPCLIPPLPLKPITRISLFRYLWTKASEYLSECEELIICGYSLPATDNIAVSLFSDFSNNKIKKITVIDPDPLVLKEWRNLLNRKNLKKASWDYKDSLQDYIS